MKQKTLLALSSITFLTAVLFGDSTEQSLGHGIQDLPASVCQDLLYNGNLERGLRGWKMISNSGILRTYENLGNLALHVRSNGCAGQDNIRFYGGREYRLVWFMKSVTGAKQQAEVTWSFPGGQNFGGIFSVTDQNYRRYEIRFIAPGKGIARGTLRCRNLGTDSILFDEFFLDEVDPQDELPTRIVLLTPYSGNRIYSSMPIQEITGKLVSTSIVSKVHLAFKQGKKVLWKQEFASGCDQFKIPAEKLSIGHYQLVAIPLDKNGHLLSETTEEIVKLPPAENEIVVGPGKNFYRNGKIFFPNVLFSSYDRGNPGYPNYFAARNGITVIGSTGEAKLLEKRKKYGFMYILQLSGIYEPLARLDEAEFRIKFTAALKSFLTPAVRQDPFLFAYDLSDEPLARDIPRKTHSIAQQILREIDPYHLQYYNEAPRGVTKEYVERYARYADIISTDIYPVMPQSLHSSLKEKYLPAVGDYAKMLCAFTEDRKPVCLVLQAFSWKEMEKHPSGRLPTHDELRFMVFDALVHGASMLSFHNDMNFDSNFYMQVLFPVVRESSMMFPVFRTGDSLKDIQADAPLAFCAKKYRGSYYLIVLNRSDKTLKGKITGVPETVRWVLGEQREIAVKNKAFTDEFGPYSVHIYSSENGLPPLPNPTPGNQNLEHFTGNIFAGFFEQPEKLQGANWIWYPGEEMKADSSISAVCNFSVNGDVKSALLYATADNQLQCFVNGTSVMQSKSWIEVRETDVASWLKPGSNELRINAQNKGGVAGLLAVLDITYLDGKKERIVSDPSWQVINAAAEKAQANVIAPIGGGRWKMYTMKIVSERGKTRE